MTDATGTATPARRGRPSTGARERILEAAIEVLKADGYAGLTIAKVAARAGESKPLVTYHYGSKQGLVQARRTGPGAQGRARRSRASPQSLTRRRSRAGGTAPRSCGPATGARTRPR